MHQPLWLLRLMDDTMKTLLAILLFSAAALAQTATAPGTTPTPSIATDAVKANSDQARQLLDKAIAALGGDAYLNIKDFEQVGRGYGFSQNAPTGIGIPYWRFYR